MKRLRKFFRRVFDETLGALLDDMMHGYSYDKDGNRNAQ